MRVFVLKIWSATFRKIWYLFFNEGPINILGRLIFPFISKKRVEKAITASFEKYTLSTLFDEIIMSGYNQYYKNLSDEEKEKVNREIIWGKNAVAWNLSKEKEYALDKSIEFMPHREDIFERVATYSDNFSIHEIGTGNGMTLEYMQKRFHFHCYNGIDINSKIIANNSQKYSGIQFNCIDANDYFSILDENMIVLSFGCLMYFTPTKLSELINILAKKKSTIVVALNEPNVENYQGLQSSLLRDRFQYAHNYHQLFLLHGFRIEYEIFSDGRTTLIAKKDKDSKNEQS